MKYIQGVLVLLMPCAVYPMYHAVTKNNLVQELTKLTKLSSVADAFGNTSAACVQRQRSEYVAWQARFTQKRTVNDAHEIERAWRMLGFTRMPDAAQQSLIDTRVDAMLAHPLFCDAILYHDHRTQEVVRTLARELLMAATILHAVLAQQQVSVPVLEATSYSATPLSTLAHIFARYVVYEAPDVNQKTMEHIVRLITQVVREGQRQGPRINSSLDVQTQQILDYYIQRIMPLWYGTEYVLPAAKHVPTREMYEYAQRILSRDQKIKLPVDVDAQIAIWRTRALDLLQELIPYMYPQPHAALKRLLAVLVQDINGARMIIEAYLRHQSIAVALHQPSLCVMPVYEQVMKLVRLVATQKTVTEKDAAHEALQEQMTTIAVQLPAEYQNVLKEYFDSAHYLGAREGVPQQQQPQPGEPLVMHPPMPLESQHTNYNNSVGSRTGIAGVRQ